MKKRSVSLSQSRMLGSSQALLKIKDNTENKSTQTLQEKHI